MLAITKDNPSFIDLAFAGLGLFCLYQLYLYLTVGAARRKLIEQHDCKLPAVYPYSGPYGIRLAFRFFSQGKTRTVLQDMRNRFLNYGNTVRTQILGTKIITTCEPENIKAILSLRFSDFQIWPLRQMAFSNLFGAGIFTANGLHWEHSRAMLRPSFMRAQVADLDTFETHVGHVIRSIPTDGSTVDLSPLFFDLTLDSSTEFLFGESANTLTTRAADPGAPNISDCFTYCMETVGKRIRFGTGRELPNRHYSWCKKVVCEFADRYVQRAIDYHRSVQAGEASDEKVESRYIFLYELAKQTQDPDVLRAEALNILLAGRDTTASLMSNLWNILSKRPDIWSKLQAEVDELNGKRPSFEEMKNMKFLRCCLNESLRLHPVVPANSRAAVRDTVIPRGGGPDGKSPVFVKKGELVSYNVYSMHRREDIYGPDAAEFKPERWETLKPGWEYLPFNGGPRICLGQQFALTETSYITIRLMQHFRTIEPRDVNPWEEWLTVTCTNWHGAKVALRK